MDNNNKLQYNTNKSAHNLNNNTKLKLRWDSKDINSMTRKKKKKINNKISSKKIIEIDIQFKPFQHQP